MIQQRQFAFELSTLESIVSRIADIHEAERDLLRALVRIFHQSRQRGAGWLQGDDGEILLEPSKRELADALGVGFATIKRRLRTIRDEGARYVSVELSEWRTHLYSIDFRGIYSAPLLDRVPESAAAPIVSEPRRRLDPGSPLTRGITNRDQGDHRGGSGGSRSTAGGSGENAVNKGVCAPSRGDQGDHVRATIEPTKNQPDQMKRKPFSADGSLNLFRFRGEVERREFRDPHAVELRFRECVAGRVLEDTETHRLAFFSLMVSLGRKGPRNPGGMLLKLIRGEQDPFGKTWLTRPANCDEDEARAWIRQLDKEQREREQAAAGHPLDEWTDEDLYADELDEPLDTTSAGDQPQSTKVDQDDAGGLLTAAELEQLQRSSERHRGRVLQLGSGNK